jgi:peptidoglycan/LPS O-acetylase OafA/YrhL
MWNNPGWSLSVEAFFYAAFPFLVARIANWSVSTLIRVTAAIYIATMGLAYLFVALHSHPPTWKWEPQIDYCMWIAWLGCNPLAHAHEFLMGMAAFVWIREERSGRRPQALSGSTAVWIAICGIVLLTAWHRPIPFMPALAGFHGPLFALLIYGLAKQRGAVARLLSTPAFVYLGEISYSLYLTHVTVWMNVEGFNRDHPYIRQDSMLNVVLCLALAIGVAAACYKFVEEPNRKVLRDRLIGVSEPQEIPA